MKVSELLNLFHICPQTPLFDVLLNVIIYVVGNLCVLKTKSNLNIINIYDMTNM